MPPNFLHGAEVTQINDGVRSIRLASSSVIGIVGTASTADAAKFPLDTPVLVTGPRSALELGVDGTLLDAYNAIAAQGVGVAVVVRVEEGANAAETLANVTGTAANETGVYALLNASAVTKQQPRILIAPGHTTPADVAAKNPVAAALEAIAPRLRAVAVIDGPNTTEANALTYADLWGTDRTYLVDPAVRVFDATNAVTETQPASAFVAGVISRTDNDLGFWFSPSNKQVFGITGLARPISFNLSSAETQANRLNEVEVTTIVQQDGFRLWGNRTTSADPQWAFLSVRRTADVIYDSIEDNHLWAMDKPFSQQLLLDIRDGVQALLDRLVARGALLGGRCYPDPELNTQTTLQAGQLYLDFDIEPPAPLERLTFRAHRNGDYYEELVSSVAAAAS